MFPNIALLNTWICRKSDLARNIGHVFHGRNGDSKRFIPPWMVAPVRTNAPSDCILCECRMTCLASRAGVPTVTQLP